MPIISLSIDRFRNLEPVELQFSPQVNLFVGPNGAGKTSLLESLYVMARARSFRSGSLEKLIRSGASGFQLVARVRTAGDREVPVGLKRSNKKLIARIDGEPVRRLSDLAALFPVQWVGGNLHGLVEEGPIYRRRYLDWGLFHVKPLYATVWKRFEKLLRQRNAALRNGLPRNQVRVWDQELAARGEELHRFRQDYMAQLSRVIREVTRQLLDLSEDIEVCYRRGWSAGISYQEALERGIEADTDGGYTRAGPQRAELLFSYQNRPAVERLSRGQQKLFVLALKVAQATVLRREAKRTSLFLIDDVGAELDLDNQRLVMQLLQSIEAQVFATAINEPGESGWDMGTLRRFHVKHGSVSKVI